MAFTYTEGQTAPRSEVRDPCIVRCPGPGPSRNALKRKAGKQEVRGQRSEVSWRKLRKRSLQKSQRRPEATEGN